MNDTDSRVDFRHKDRGRFLNGAEESLNGTDGIAQFVLCTDMTVVGVLVAQTMIPCAICFGEGIVVAFFTETEDQGFDLMRLYI